MPQLNYLYQKQKMLHLEYNRERREMSIMRISRRLIALLVIAGFFTACGGGGTTSSGPTQINLTSIVITPNPTMAPGTTIQLVATGVYSNSSKRNITSSVVWDSSDTTIATISNTPGSQGMATASMEIGSTTITATSGDIFGIVTLSTSTVKNIAVTPESISIAPGTNQQFTARGTLESGYSQDLTNWVIWTSSDSNIASMGTTSGLATAGDVSGSAIIKAIYTGVSGTANLISSPVISIMVSPASASIAKGTTQQFTASGTLANNATQDLTSSATWLSSNTGIAKVSNTVGTKGLVTSQETGTAFITATYNLVSSPSATLSVTPAIITLLSITPVTTAIPLGKTQQYIAMGTFSDSSTQDLTSSVSWLSTVPSVASISQSGLAKPLATGTTKISATSFDKTMTSNTATLSVNPAVLESILVTPVSWEVFLSTTPLLTKQFSATGELTDGSLQDLTTSVTWSSLNSNIVTISNLEGSQGLATVQSLGTTTITASFPGVSVRNAATVTVQN
jgi:hypothetical protein